MILFQRGQDGGLCHVFAEASKVKPGVFRDAFHDRDLIDVGPIEVARSQEPHVKFFESAILTPRGLRGLESKPSPSVLRLMSAPDCPALILRVDLREGKVAPPNVHVPLA